VEDNNANAWKVTVTVYFRLTDPGYLYALLASLVYLGLGLYLYSCTTRTNQA